MTGFPFHEYRIQIMTIERPKEALRSLLEQNGYKQILRLSRWGETLWIHSDFEAGMDMSNLLDFHAKKQREEEKTRLRG
jgi:hypothetical protein